MRNARRARSAPARRQAVRTIRIRRGACGMSGGAGTHCEGGVICGAGSCVPDEVVPDLSGLWLTRHDFNLRETVPPGVREIIVAVRLIDQTLLGKLTIPGLPSWLQDILNTFVSRLLQQYLPEWTQQLIHVSDDLFTVLSHLRSEGRMRLTRNGDATRLQGKEVWTSLVFYWLPLCNGDISGDPGEPPECARIDVVTSDADGSDETAQCKGELLPSIRVRVSPITARVVNAGQRHALEVDRRQVSLQMDKVILILFDQILAQITGDTLDFSGSAAISGQADDEVCHQGSVPGTCAGRLEAGQWTGDFFFQLLQRQPGTGAAWRPE